MKYYLQLEGNNQRFRLQNDNTWRKLENNDFADTDLISNDNSRIFIIQEIDSTISLDGKKWKLNTTSSDLFDDDALNYKVYVKRDVSPSVPSKEQLIQTIANGKDNRTNTLILNTDGLFELRDFEKINISLQYPSIVVRNETFIEGNDYVGIEASKDKEFIDDHYKQNLEYWLMHLQTGKTNFFSDGELPYRVVEAIIKDINEVKF